MVSCLFIFEIPAVLHTHTQTSIDIPKTFFLFFFLFFLFLIKQHSKVANNNNKKAT